MVCIMTTERSTLVNDEKYIGLDVHQATIVVAVMDSSGKLVMESILETKAATILQFSAAFPGTFSELSDHRQRPVAGHESGESGVPQLGDSLCGKRRLLHAASSPVAGQDPGSWRAASRRTTL